MDLPVSGGGAAAATAAAGREDEGMEVKEGRPRTTLYDQHSAAAAHELPSSASKLSTSSSSPNLGDLLKFRQEEHLQQQQQQQTRSRRSASISLGTFLACEKRELSSPGLTKVAAAANTIGGRTLLDIIRDEDGESRGGGRVYERSLLGCGNNSHRISWRRTFKERLWIHRVRNPVDGVSAEGLVVPSPVAASPSGIAVLENNPVRASAGDATQPTELSMRMGATDLPSGAGSAGDQAERSGRGGSRAPAGTAEARQQQVQQVRVSLMTLLDQTDRQGGGPGFAVSALLGVEDGGEEEEEGKRYCAKCCVCMVRHKGAAFIPCGHTFCRLCCRQLLITRGSCPLCNGFILEVLDIF